MSSFWPHLKIIGICYYPNVLKEEKKKHMPLIKLLWKRILSNKQNISYDILSVDMLIFEIQGNGWEFSLMRISYKLTQRTTKTENLKNFWKCIILQTLWLFVKNGLLWVTSLIQHLITSLWDRSTFFAHKEEKQAKKRQIQNTLREKCRAKSH